MSKFEVGDRVRHEEFGDGKVKKVRLKDYAVEFDNHLDYLHDCHADGEPVCKKGTGWYCKEPELTKLRKVSPRKNEVNNMQPTYNGIEVTGISNTSKVPPHEKKKRPALWIEVDDQYKCIVLRGNKNFMLCTPLMKRYKTTSACNQQARRLARQLGIEVRK
ncbi:MAG TPA: hypothetical protein VLJ10_02245 [Candidatus Bathyarchaeia archaeon]|nr:hypothetical protein [Candidatus Bathyarchaeia archaeon]